MNYFNVGKIVNTQGLQGEMSLICDGFFGRTLLKKVQSWPCLMRRINLLKL